MLGNSVLFWHQGVFSVPDITTMKLFVCSNIAVIKTENNLRHLREFTSPRITSPTPGDGVYDHMK